jgi:hypothetical protein
MIELNRDALRFAFPEVHPDARLRVGFQRTLRIPDDGRDHPLPPGLGRFPLRHVDDFAGDVPPAWVRHGGVMLPMYQSEALWVNFDAPHGYPFAVKVAAGKINAVTGEDWDDGLHRDPQDYVAVPEQPWLDGFCVEEGTIRQFVAMPLGSGYSAEAQVTGEGEVGGLQIVAHPLKAERWEAMHAVRDDRVACHMESAVAYDAKLDMGLAPGGRMRQEIYDDPRDFEDWDLRHRSRCFVHLANSLVWRAITGQEPPTTPPTAKAYTEAGLPWFEHWDPRREIREGSEILAGLQSVAELAAKRGDAPLPENESVEPEHVVTLRQGLAEDQVREGAF